MELTGRSGCYVLTAHLMPNERKTWVGECTDGLAQGTGTLTRVWENGESVGTGPMRDGKQHGSWTGRREDGTVWEGSYAEGQSQGRWTWRYADGSVHEGSVEAGQRQGQWVIRQANGTVREGPYGRRSGAGPLGVAFCERNRQRGAGGGGPAAGAVGHPPGRWDGRRRDRMWTIKRRGRWVWRSADGTVQEGPVEAGQRQGQWVIRQANGTVSEGPYVAGQRQGRWIERSANGAVHEGSYVAGQRQGRWTIRQATGPSAKGRMWMARRTVGGPIRHAGGAVSNVTYANGQRQ